MRRPNLVPVLKFPHLIRFRLTLWYTGLAALVLATFVGGVFYEFNQYQFQSYTDLLTQTFNQQVQVGLPPLTQVGHGSRYQYVRSPSTQYYPVYFNDPNEPIRSGSPPMMFIGPHGEVLNKPPAGSVLNNHVAKDQQKQATKSGTGAPLQTDYKGWRYIAIPLQKEGERVIAQMAVPISRVQAQVDELKRILVYVAGVMLAISAVGGWMLAGRALKPIDEITRRAQQISAHDLSQRLNLEQGDELGRMAATFDDMITRLQEAFERQKRFTSDASHELRTPLTVMQADLGLALARPRTPEEYRHTLLSMDEEVTRLSTIVNDLLMLTRIDVDPAGMQHQPVALHEMLAGLARQVQVIASERDITVETDRLDPVTVMGDSTRLRQLFTNLLDNAVTYTDSGGRVTVKLERTRDGARVSVADTGIGIAPDDLSRIFERFYRSSAGREQNAHGTGLGLAISRSVVQAHRGEIAVQSAPGEGTTFTVVLPSDSRKRVRRVYTRRALIPGAAR